MPWARRCERGCSALKIDGKELPKSPLWTLRALLGDERVDEIGEMALELCLKENFSVEELTCFAEHFRLFAEGEARREHARAARRRKGA